MKKIVSSILILMIVVPMLGACSARISNKQIEKDIISLPCFYGTVSVKEMTVIEKNETNELMEYKLSVLLKSYDFTTTADIKLIYTKNKGEWLLSRSKVDIVKVSSNGTLSINPAYNDAILDRSHKLFNYQSDNKKRSTLALVSATFNLDTVSGSGTIIIGETYQDAVLTMDAQYTLKATYNVTNGWTYELVDWIYHDSTKWTGVYDIHWTAEDPGYPGGGLNSFYKLGQDATNIQLSGECRITRRMNQPDNDIIENTLQLSFDYAGVHLSGQPTFARMTNRLFFELPSRPDTLLILEYEPFYTIIAGYDPNNDYYGQAPYLFSVMTKRP